MRQLDHKIEARGAAIQFACRALGDRLARRFEWRAAAERAEVAEKNWEEPVPKGYWITFYRSISDPAVLAAYAKLAGPAIASHGGRFLVRGLPAKTYEQGVAQRTVAIEFDSVEQAIAAHDSPAYQEALAALGNACEREIRIVEGAG